MSSVISSELIRGSAKQAATEAWFRRFLVVVLAIAGLGVLCHFGMMLWAQHEFASPESVVAAQSTMLAHGGGLYYSLRAYPYTVTAYMPLFYGLEAGLLKTGLPVYQAGRLLSFAALLGIFALVWRLLLLYTGERSYAWTGIALCASTSLLLSWGTVAQVDTLAVFFSVAGFYQYSRYAVRGEKTLLGAGACVILAFFTKQTAIACPAAIFLLLLFERPKVALRFGAGVGGAALVLFLGINTALHGSFIDNTILANLNPFAWEKLNQHLSYLLIASGQLVLVAGIGFTKAVRSPAKALFVYLALAMLVLVLTAPKIGSDSNYQVETTVALILCACAALQALDFFALLFRGSKSWVTLLLIPVALHLMLNFRITGPLLIGRFVKERRFRQEVAALRPYLAGNGRAIATDMNAMAHLRGRLEVEPLIYTLLVDAGRIDPSRVRGDIAAGAFSTIVLYQDLSRPFDPDPELRSLPEEQLNEIRKHYQLVQHIPGPYLDGVFVYKPVRGALPSLEAK